MKKNRIKLLALTAGLSLVLPALTACGNSGQEPSKESKPAAEASSSAEAETETETSEASEASDTSATDAKASGEALKEVEFGGGAGFVMDLPKGFKYDENMFCYISADGAVKYWPNDGSMLEKQSNFEDVMNSDPGELKEVGPVGRYTVSYKVDPNSFYGLATQYYINFNGCYEKEGYYGCRVIVTSEKKDEAATQTKEIIDCLATIRPKGEAVSLTAGSGTAGETNAAGTSTASGETTPVSPLSDLKINFTGEQTAAMSNYMNYGCYANEGDTFYGNAFSKSGSPELVRFEVKKNGAFADVASHVILDPKCSPYNVTIHGDDIYYLRSDEEGNNQGLFKVAKAGGAKPQSVRAEAADYFQLIGDKIYYADKDYKYYQAALDGSQPELLVDKEIYYPYFINPDWLIYQDDADGESLHLLHVPSKTDIKVCELVSNRPIIAGSMLYFSVEKDGTTVLARTDLSAVKIEYNEADKTFKYEFPTEFGEKKISPDYAITSSGYIFDGTDTGRELEQWKLLENESDTSDVIYKYCGPVYLINYAYESELVESINIVSEEGGGSQSLPRMD